MSEAHTKGPWGFAWGGGHALIIPSDGGATIAGVPYSDDHEIPKAEANARLIAAAPDLLEALNAILPFIPKTSASDGGAAKHSENVRAADKVRAAIARAEGVKDE
jgi:hypothetical protein